MAPFTSPSCPSSRAICTSMFGSFSVAPGGGHQRRAGARPSGPWPGGRTGARRLTACASWLVLPGAVLDLDRHARALVQAQVVIGGHGEDAVRTGHFLELLQCIAQRGAEL